MIPVPGLKGVQKFVTSKNKHFQRQKSFWGWKIDELSLIHSKLILENTGKKYEFFSILKNYNWFIQKFNFNDQINLYTSLEPQILTFEKKLGHHFDVLLNQNFCDLIRTAF